jgi:hypothetical protein
VALQGILERARGLLRDADDLSVKGKRRRLDCARRLLQETRQAVVSQVEFLADESRLLLQSYDGLPTAFSPMDTLGVANSERAHVACYAWLLDPRGSHGLSDTMLRFMLGRCGRSRHVELASSPGTLNAVVATEQALDAGVIDAVVAAPELVVGIEFKVWAQEDEVEWHGEKLAQTEAYGAQLRERLVRDRVLVSMGTEAVRLAGPEPVTTILFVHPSGTARARDASAVNMTWLEVERDLAAAIQRHDTAPQAHSFLMSFRSNLLTSTAALDPPMAAIEDLRRWVDIEHLRNASPLRAYLRMRKLSVASAEESDD